MRFGIGGGSRWLRGGASVGRGGVRGGIGIGPFSITGGSRGRRAHWRDTESAGEHQPISDTAFALGVLVVSAAVSIGVLYFVAHLLGVFGLGLVAVGVLVGRAYERNTGAKPPLNSFAIASVRWGWGLSGLSALGTQSWIWYLPERRVEAVDEICHYASALTIVLCYPYTVIFGTSIFSWAAFNWACLVLASFAAFRYLKPKTT